MSAQRKSLKNIYILYIAWTLFVLEFYKMQFAVNNVHFSLKKKKKLLLIKFDLHDLLEYLQKGGQRITPCRSSVMNNMKWMFASE